jgi:ferredoxin
MHTVLIRINNEQKSLEVENESTIFDGCQQAGIELPHGCLAGSCGACKIEVLDGAENLKEPSVIEANTLESIRARFLELFPEKKGITIRLGCRAKVLGPIEVTPLIIPKK